MERGDIYGIKQAAGDLFTFPELLVYIHLH